MSRVATYSGPFLRGMRGLGQDTSIFDIQYGGGDPSLYDTGVSYGLPVYGPPAPTAAQIATDAATSNPVTAGGGYTPPDAANPAYNFQPYPGYVAPKSPGIVQAITSAMTPTPAKPSPTVAVPLSSSSIGMFLTNNLGTVLEIAAVAVLASMFMSSGGRRRR